MELLAPVGTKEGFQAVLEQRPDVIYLGAGDMNARSSEAQLPVEELADLVSQAKKVGVKIYFTLNILFKDGELSQALDLADQARRAGVNALIVQDKGLMRLLNERFPDLALHASTQCSVGTREQIRELLNFQIRRVVLARELSLEQIRDLTTYAHSLGIEVEVFTHGATCMSVSGQCHMSFCIGGRSANRGACAQPCRKSYTLLCDGKPVRDDAAWLSPKDLSYFPYLRALAEIPVDALKIEGRLRSSEYQAQVTAIFKRALAEIKKGRSDREIITPERKRNLEIAFNRGGAFQAAFLTKHRSEEFLSPYKVTHWGYPLGKVLEIRADQGILRYRPEEKEYLPAEGSQISLKSPSGKTVATAPVGIIRRRPGPVKAGQETGGEVELMGFHPRILRSLRLPLTVWQQKQKMVPEQAFRQEEKKPLSLHLTKRGEAYQLTLKSDGKELYFSSDELSSPPEETDRRISLSRIRQQMAKLGNTPYTLTRFSTDLSEEEAPHWHISGINAFRRAALEKLTGFSQGLLSESDTNNTQQAPPIPFFAKRIRPTSIKKILNLPNFQAGDSLEGHEDREDELIVFPLEELYLSAKKEPGLKALRKDLGKSRLGAYLSPIQAWSSAESVDQALLFLADQGLSALVSPTSGAAERLEELGLDLELFLWQGGQVTNSKSFEYFCERGYHGVMISPELPIQDQWELAERFHDSPTRPILFGSGPLEAMFSRFCPVGFANPACRRCRKGSHYQLMDGEGRVFSLTPKRYADCSLQIWDSRILRQNPPGTYIRADQRL